MKKILEEAISNKTLVSISLNPINWDKRIIGYVNSMNETTIIVDEVSVLGIVVKRRQIKMEQIKIVEIDDSYNRHLEKLKGIGDTIKNTKSLYYLNKGNSFIKKLPQLISQRCVCTFFFGTEYITGILKEINDNFLIINSLGYMGTKEGKVFCKIESITKIRYDGVFERKIAFLGNVN